MMANELGQKKLSEAGMAREAKVISERIRTDGAIKGFRAVVRILRIHNSKADDQGQIDLTVLHRYLFDIGWEYHSEDARLRSQETLEGVDSQVQNFNPDLSGECERIEAEFDLNKSNLDMSNFKGSTEKDRLHQKQLALLFSGHLISLGLSGRKADKVVGVCLWYSGLIGKTPDETLGDLNPEQAVRPLADRVSAWRKENCKQKALRKKEQQSS